MADQQPGQGGGGGRPQQGRPPEGHDILGIRVNNWVWMLIVLLPILCACQFFGSIADGNWGWLVSWR